MVLNLMSSLFENWKCSLLYSAVVPTSHTLPHRPYTRNEFGDVELTMTGRRGHMWEQNRRSQRACAHELRNRRL